MDVLSARKSQTRTWKMNHVEKNALAGLAKTKMPVTKIEKNRVRERLLHLFRVYENMLRCKCYNCGTPFAPT